MQLLFISRHAHARTRLRTHTRIRAHTRTRTCVSVDALQVFETTFVNGAGGTNASTPSTDWGKNGPTTDGVGPFAEFPAIDAAAGRLGQLSWMTWSNGLQFHDTAKGVVGVSAHSCSHTLAFGDTRVRSTLVFMRNAHEQQALSRTLHSLFWLSLYLLAVPNNRHAHLFEVFCREIIQH
jgi:hypothetical protein